MLLMPHGGSGYRFILKGGSDGATWFIKKPNARDNWGIRLSFGSFFLAMYGLGAAKAHVDLVTARLDIRFGPDDISISRANRCVDILAPDFDLIPDHFVMQSKVNRSDYISPDEMAVNGKSGRVTSVTIGKPNNRQVIFYDKRAEVIARENRVWRVEFRAGKKLLKDRWGIRIWEQFFARFGDLCREAGQLVRYGEPDGNNPNRAHWPNHPLWEIVCAEMNAGLTEMRSGADPNPMKEVHREQHIALITRNILGSAITLGALQDSDTDGLEGIFADLAANMTSEVKSAPDKAAKQIQDAKDRYIFIRKPEPPT
jgi:hypothetical protein